MFGLGKLEFVIRLVSSRLDMVTSEEFSEIIGRHSLQTVMLLFSPPEFQKGDDTCRCWHIYMTVNFLILNSFFEVLIIYIFNSTLHTIILVQNPVE